MINMHNLSPVFKSDVQIFRANTQVNVQGFQRWVKPKGASMVAIWCIGGGGGFTRTAGSAGGGGAGGACGNMTYFQTAALLLPNELFIQVGAGGVGGAASTNGAGGLNSYVLTSTTVVLPNIVVYSGVNAPGGGAAGASGSGGVGGTVPTIPVTQPFNRFGIWNTFVGLVGGAGGAQTGAVGTSITAWAAHPLSPGAGGAGCTTTDFDGGAQTATAILDIGAEGYYPTGAGNIAKAGTGITTAINGSSGVKRDPASGPLFQSGGAGGGSNNSGTAGNGGAGGYGCGGGGGGAGTTGGRGGNGGDGLVIIVSW
jgi:hypothetical protein